MVKITLITATYNSAATLPSTIESVLRQSYTNIEYLIIDGASKDNTLNIAHSYQAQFDGRMRIVSEPDKGIYDALNKGVWHATGDVVGFLHADDFFASDDVLSQIASTFEQTGCDVLYGDLHYIDTQNSKVIRNWISSPFKKKMLSQGWMPAHPTLYIKKQVYNSIGEFDTSYKISADYDFILRCFSATPEKKIVYLPSVLVKMRVGGASNKNIRNIVRKMKEDIRAIRGNHIGNPYLVLLQKNTSKITQFIK